ncbi:hypothetical protein [Legionella gresilensis]|uniref:hypothetical protein n=1 Tax=Legionella gresilensis TaxID=91823 RepID=UPI0010411FBF|nr:hypothetical protein [Legionella gresilensis]
MASQTHEDLLNYVKSKSKRIALIYSPIELHEYIVEIIAKDTVLFIHKGKKNRHFHTLKDAVDCASAYGAKEFYLCVDNTHDECGSLTSEQPFDYIPLHAGYKPTNN